MANSYKYAIKYSTEQSVAKAYRDYCASAAENYSTLMSMVTEAIDNADVTDSEDGTILADEVIARYSGLGVTTEAVVPTNRGIISLRNYLTGIIQTVARQCRNIDEELPITEDPILHMATVDGDAYNTTINEVLTELNSNYHAIIVEAAVATGYSISSSIAERVNIIRDYVSEHFQNAYTDISNSLSSAVERVRAGIGILEYVSGKLESSGINKGAESGSLFVQSSDFKYTGSSPASAYAWNAVGMKVAGAFVVTIVGVCMAVKTILSGILSVGRKIFASAKKYITETLINPYDIERINSHGNGTVDGFYNNNVVRLVKVNPGSGQIRAPYLIEKLADGPIHFDFIPCEFIISPRSSWVEYTPGSTILSCFDTIAKIHNLDIDMDSDLFTIASALCLQIRGEPGGHDLLTVVAVLTDTADAGYTPIYDMLRDYILSFNTTELVADCMMKVKPINYKYAYLEPSLDDGGHCYAYRIGDFIDRLDAMIVNDDYRVDVDRSEDEFYKDFECGLIYSKVLSVILLREAYGFSDENIRADIVSFGQSSDLRGLLDQNITATVTNKTFFDLLVNGSTNIGIDFVHDYDNVGHNIAYALNKVFEVRSHNPLNYEFWPYSKNCVRWFDSSFRVKPDEENEQAFISFVSTAIIAAVVITIGVTLFIKLRKMSLMSSLRTVGLERNCASAAASGELTRGQLSMYKKSRLKTQILNALTGNMLSSATVVAGNAISSVGTTEKSQVNLDPVLTLIR